MSPEELRLECLRLAACGPHPDHIRVIEAAEAMFNFIMDRSPDRPRRMVDMNAPRPPL
jgi:hypothetical protein